jgi:hypothetical protein
MESVEITLDMIRNAPARETKRRGRAKGSSAVEKAFRAGFSDENCEIVFSQTLKPSEYQMLRTAVNRENGEDTSKVSPYRDALESLGLIEAILAESGEGNDKRITLALARVSAL